jgi:hypothetical protein
MRGGAIRPFPGLPSTGSSLGAMMGSRSGRFEAWPRRFCITRLVTVIRLMPVRLCGGSGISSCTNVRVGGIATYEGYSVAIRDNRGCKIPGESRSPIEGNWRGIDRI